jgi:tetratricopeptide (TPR) repeat protein
MSDKERIKVLIKEAALYQKQGLFEESKEKYEEILAFIQHDERYVKDKKLIDAVQGKIRIIAENLDEIDKYAETPMLSEEVQDLISRLFSSSKDKDMAAIEGAVALAKFGQYQKALEEFQRLIEEGKMPLVAAKNALMCHMAVSSPDAAIAQFTQWVSRDTFSRSDLKYIRTFLENTLEKQGIKVDLPKVDEAPAEEGESEEREVDIIDISSVGVQLANGLRKGETVEFEVTFQLGNKISIIIPAQQRDLANAFKTGLRLSEMQCFSPLAIFNARGTVSGLRIITSGPRRGDHALDITIDGV